MPGPMTRMISAAVPRSSRGSSRSASGRYSTTPSGRPTPCRSCPETPRPWLRRPARCGISNALPSDYDDELGDIPALDTDRLLTVFGSQVAELVRAVRAGSGLLEGVDQRFKGSDAYGSAVHLHRKLTRLLVQNRDRDSD